MARTVQVYPVVRDDPLQQCRPDAPVQLKKAGGRRPEVAPTLGDRLHHRARPKHPRRPVIHNSADPATSHTLRTADSSANLVVIRAAEVIVADRLFRA